MLRPVPPVRLVARFAHRLVLPALRDRRGVTAMEYAVIAVGIIAVAAVAADGVGFSLDAIFSRLQTYIG